MLPSPLESSLIPPMLQHWLYQVARKKTTCQIQNSTQTTKKNISTCHTIYVYYIWSDCLLKHINEPQRPSSSQLTMFLPPQSQKNVCVTFLCLSVFCISQSLKSIPFAMNCLQNPRLKHQKLSEYSKNNQSHQILKCVTPTC